MESAKIKDLKKGELFTLKPIESPKDCQVYIREDYDRTEKKFWGQKWFDNCSGRYFDGNKVVYIGFTF